MYLGLDLGTSGVKALLIDARSARSAPPMAPSMCRVRIPAGPSRIRRIGCRATEEAVGKLKAVASPRNSPPCSGIGLSGQMHGATLIDAGDKVLRPCILWNDTRSHAEAAELDANPRFRQLTGNIVFPGFTAPKLLWVKNNEPEIFAQSRARCCCPRTILRLWLTGEYISEMSDSAGTSWLDVARRAAGRRTCLPRPISTSGRCRRWSKAPRPAARFAPNSPRNGAWHPGVVVAGGAGDNAASACGMGTVKPGAAFVSLGTSGVLFAANGAYLPNPQSAVHTFCHALPDAWHQMGVILSATNSLNWLSEVTGKNAERTDRRARRRAQGAERRLVPALSFGRAHAAQ